MASQYHIGPTISIIAFALVLARLAWPDLTIDTVTAALLVVAILPWLGSIIERAKLPGGWELSFQKIESKVDRQQARLSEQERLIFEQQRIINDLVVFSMAFYIFDHLKKIYYARKNRTEYPFRKTDDFISETVGLDWLIGHGLDDGASKHGTTLLPGVGRQRSRCLPRHLL